MEKMIDAVEVLKQPFERLVVWIHEINGFTGGLSDRSYDIDEDLGCVDDPTVGSTVRYSKPEDGVSG
jgi:hypothetical protein